MAAGFKPTADPLPSYRRWYHRLAETVQIQWPAIINVSAMENFVLELMDCIEIERNELFDLHFHLQRLRQRIASGVAEKEEAVPELQIVALTLEERLDELERARHDLGRLDAIYDVAKIEYTSNLDSLHTEAIFEQYLCSAMKRLKMELYFFLTGTEGETPVVRRQRTTLVLAPSVSGGLYQGALKEDTFPVEFGKTKVHSNRNLPRTTEHLSVSKLMKKTRSPCSLRLLCCKSQATY